MCPRARAVDFCCQALQAIPAAFVAGLRQALQAEGPQQYPPQADLALVGRVCRCNACAARFASLPGAWFRCLSKVNREPAKELVARALMLPVPGRAALSGVQLQQRLPRLWSNQRLFGHAKGAFTGAATPRGYFEDALAMARCFLDEIGELPLEKMQSNAAGAAGKWRFSAGWRNA